MATSASIAALGGEVLGAPQVTIVAPAALGHDAVMVLRARGLAASTATAPRDEDESIVAWALAEPPDLPSAAAIGAAQATRGEPLLLLCPPLRRAGRGSVDRAAAAAYLRAHGVAIFDDPDAWLEAIVLVAVHGAPRGSRVAIVAEPGTWLEAAALALPHEGSRPPIAALLGALEPADAVLVDARTAPTAKTATALLVPVSPRAELVASSRWLCGVGPALRAATTAGAAVERAAIGRGPAPRQASAELELDLPRLERQLGKIGRFDRRLADHEAKVLLAAYGVPITRQAVATTPSAAVGLAKRVGYPVDIKPWGADVPSELAGCPVETQLDTAAAVRRAFSAVLTGRAEQEPAVIVRESPPAGRELAARIEVLPCVGLTVIVEAPGQAPAAAPAPLRLADAQLLAASLVASRAGEPEPDRLALANLLRRASHLMADHAPRFQTLELSRIVVGSRGDRTLVVDAAIQLEDPR